MIVHELLPRTASRGRASNLSHESGPERLKRGFDLLVGLAISVVAIPVIAVVWTFVRLTSSGPGFYSQLRVGQNGRTFRLYKIRTMRHNCEAVSGAKWSPKRDPRVTPVGRVLRKFHIDELPQLLNVLRGDMSLVGPRPERPEFVGPLTKIVPGYVERLAARPGVTGLAQIQLPPDTGVESVRRKLVFDKYYVYSRGFWLDLRIILGTFVYLLGFSFRAISKCAMLPNPLADALADTVPDHPTLGPLRSNGEASMPSQSFEVEGAPVPLEAAR